MELFHKDCKVKEIENMSMIDTVRSQMMEAMKNKDKTRKDALSMLLSALKNIMMRSAMNCGIFIQRRITVGHV